MSDEDRYEKWEGVLLRYASTVRELTALIVALAFAGYGVYKGFEQHGVGGAIVFGLGMPFVGGAIGWGLGALYEVFIMPLAMLVAFVDWLFALLRLPAFWLASAIGALLLYLIYGFWDVGK